MIALAVAAATHCWPLAAPSARVYDRESRFVGRIVCESRDAVIRDQRDRVIARVERRGSGLVVLDRDRRVVFDVR